MLLSPGLAAPCWHGGGPEPRERTDSKPLVGAAERGVRPQAQFADSNLTPLVLLSSPVSLQSRLYFFIS